MTVASRYSKHRKWALKLAAEYDNSDEGRLVALVALWSAAREFSGEERDFRSFALPRIREALGRKATA